MRNLCRIFAVSMQNLRFHADSIQRTIKSIKWECKCRFLAEFEIRADSKQSPFRFHADSIRVPCIIHAELHAKFHAESMQNAIWNLCGIFADSLRNPIVRLWLHAESVQIPCRLHAKFHVESMQNCMQNIMQNARRNLCGIFAESMQNFRFHKRDLEKKLLPWKHHRVHH